MSMPTFLKRSVDGGAVDRPHQAPARLLGHSMSHSSRTLLLPILYTNYIHTTMLHIKDAELRIPRLFSVWENSDFPSHYSTIPAGDEPLGIFNKFIVVTPFQWVPRTKYPRIMSSPADLQSNNRTRCRVSDFPHVQVVRWISLPDEWPGEK